MPNGRPFALSAVKAGETRLRTKGGASQESLYALINGFVDASRAPTSRPGTRKVPAVNAAAGVNTLPPGTIGVAFFKGQRHVFSSQPVDLGAQTKYINNTLRHPSNAAATLTKIHFASPFLGVLFVVAEFNTGEVFYYWLQQTEEWQPLHTYRIGQVVEPVTPNGYSYQANRIGEPGIAWAPNIARQVGDVVEPTAYNGFEYVCIETYGATPRSGAVEPVWPVVENATVIEDTTGGTAPTPPSQPDPGTTLPPEIDDRYNRDGQNGIYEQLR